MGKTTTIEGFDDAAQAEVPLRRTQERRAAANARYARSLALKRAEPGQRQPSLAGRRTASDVVCIFEEDPDLAEALCAEERRRIAAYSRARVVIANPPRWNPPEFDSRLTFGLLLLEGLMARRVRVGQARSTELLGPGDILRPWDEPCRLNPNPPESEWPVFRTTRLAVLDERITRLICQRPELVISFSGRLLRRARYAEYVASASHIPRVDERLLALLWHLAGLWGRVTPKGVFLPLRITQTILGEIIGARRPSVSVAMKRLCEQGQIVPQAGQGYLLIGDPDVPDVPSFPGRGPWPTPVMQPTANGTSAER